ncbi:unnamed protein product [Haemonchus placei]|uniref:I-set domain-containing protein n=1 Tax=Haemonchus placei TaxID=6290 RepID=A0A0N4VVI1_HAEPC|nr:unnamed protein product [Haemonchus placei]
MWEDSENKIFTDIICSINRSINRKPHPTLLCFPTSRFFKDQELKNDRFVQKIKRSVGKWAVTLIMKNPTQDDQGVYKVVATNSAGSHSVEQQYVHSQTANEIFKTQ